MREKLNSFSATIMFMPKVKTKNSLPLTQLLCCCTSPLLASHWRDLEE